MSAKHTHQCATPGCGFTWECDARIKKGGECEYEIEKAAKVNGTGPFCNLCLHVEMARRHAALRGWNLIIECRI